MSRLTAKITPTRVWIAVFVLWGVLLSGVLGDWGRTPGILQAIRLNHLLNAKQAQLAQMELDVQKTEVEIKRLDTSRVAQEREIRRVLGYAAKDEIIFDFSSARPAPDKKP